MHSGVHHGKFLCFLLRFRFVLGNGLVIYTVDWTKAVFLAVKAVFVTLLLHTADCARDIFFKIRPS